MGRTRAQPDGLAAIHRVRRRLESANEAMTQEILRAFEAGNSVRAIADAALMSDEKVRAIVAGARRRQARQTVR